MFLFCISFSAVAVAFPQQFFRIAGQRQHDQEAAEGEQPYRAGEAPYNQEVPQSSVFSDADTETESNESPETDSDGGAGSFGGDADAPDGSEVENEGDTPDTDGAAVSGGAAVGAGGAPLAGGNSNSDPASNTAPDMLGGGPGRIVNGQQSSAGRNFGIAFGVLAVVGLAAGGAFYAYRKRRAAANYGSRF